MHGTCISQDRPSRMSWFVARQKYDKIHKYLAMPSRFMNIANSREIHYYVMKPDRYSLKNNSEDCSIPFQAHVHKHHSLVRMGYYHLIATNLCIWIRTLTSEILEEYLHNLYDHKDDYYTTTTTPPLNLSAGINEVPQLLAEGKLHTMLGSECSSKSVTFTSFISQDV